MIERRVKETDRHRVRKRSMKRKNDETETEKYKQKEYERLKKNTWFMEISLSMKF